MNCEEKDLFQKCQDIISDGKLSEGDVRQLSEYINASPNAADTLIGKQLVGPLLLFQSESSPAHPADCLLCPLTVYSHHLQLLQTSGYAPQYQSASSPVYPADY